MVFARDGAPVARSERNPTHVNREAIHRYIDEHIDEHVAHIQAWVRQKSVSWDDLGVADCAELVAELSPPPGLPGGRGRSPAASIRASGPITTPERLRRCTVTACSIRAR